MKSNEKTRRKNRYDPLYRVIDETKEMQLIESTFFEKFDRLKKINNLGIIPEVFEMAKYSKYEHTYGTIYQVNNLIEIAENVIDQKYQNPLIIAAHFIHIGHCPFTFSTERGVLIACFIGKKTGNLAIQKFVDDKIESAYKTIGKTKENLEPIKKTLYSLTDFKQLYRIFSMAFIVKNWKRINSKAFTNALSSDDLKNITHDLLTKNNDGYKYLDLCDRVDYVQRDALYFGAVKIDVSPKHIYRKSSRYHPIAASDETKLIDANLEYLSNVYYRHKSVIYFTALYEKIIAALILEKNFKLEYLEELNDESFKRLICQNKMENGQVKLSKIWCKRADDLFNKRIKFHFVFFIEEVQFSEDKSIIEIEEQLITQNGEFNELLEYPFRNLVLLSMDHSKRQMTFSPNMRLFDFHFFINNDARDLTELLKIINRLSSKISVKNHEKISRGIGNLMSPTGKCRINNKPVNTEVAKQILLFERENNCQWETLKSFLDTLFGLEEFEEIRSDVAIYIMKNLYLRYSEENLELSDERIIDIYAEIVRTIFTLSIEILQNPKFCPFFEQINKILSHSITTVKNEGQRGIIFEAICLLAEIGKTIGNVPLIINGLVVIDPSKEKESQDHHEYDILKFFLNENNQAELHIFVCSISDGIRANNKQSISDLADEINLNYPELIIKTWYMIPKDKKKENWKPILEETGRSYNVI